VLLNHHVYSLLSILKVELVELLSFISFSLRFFLHIMIVFHWATKGVHGLITCGTSSKYFLS
jgi:hypothetical protein